jgi:hypothetical protein
MATQSVRFEFYCSETKTLTYTHENPLGLIRNAGSAGATAEYNDLFIRTITPIMKVGGEGGTGKSRVIEALVLDFFL